MSGPRSRRQGPRRPARRGCAPSRALRLSCPMSTSSHSPPVRRWCGPACSKSRHPSTIVDGDALRQLDLRQAFRARQSRAGAVESRPWTAPSVSTRPATSSGALRRIRWPGGSTRRWRAIGAPSPRTPPPRRTPSSAGRCPSRGATRTRSPSARSPSAWIPSFGNPYNDIGAYLIELGRHDEASPGSSAPRRRRATSPGTSPTSTSPAST